MNTELEQKLFDKYPDLFENRHKTPMQSCMSFGIECNSDWDELISSVCWRIKQHETNIEDRKKYNPEYNSDYVQVKFDQIKEKFGGLRIYYSGGDDYIHGAISMAEEMSYKICEVCGNKGYPNKGGWITTLCDSCRNSNA